MSGKRRQSFADTLLKLSRTKALQRRILTFSPPSPTFPLSRLPAFVFVCFQVKQTGLRALGLLEKVAATEFLGMEFATWLYWHSETHGGKMRLPDHDEFELWFEAPVQMAADYGEATNIALKGGTPLEGAEARTAFREGKKLTRARMRLNYRNQTYTFGFNALNYGVSGLKVPAPPNSSGPDYVFLRLEIFEEFEKFFESLFESFLKIRLNDKAWGAEKEKLSDWMRNFEIG